MATSNKALSMRSATTDKEHLRSVEDDLRVESMKEHVHMRVKSNDPEMDLRMMINDPESGEHEPRRDMWRDLFEMLEIDEVKLKESFLEHLTTMMITMEEKEFTSESFCFLNLVACVNDFGNANPAAKDACTSVIQWKEEGRSRRECARWRAGSSGAQRARGWTRRVPGLSSSEKAGNLIDTRVQ